MVEHSFANLKDLVRFQAQFHTGDMDFEEAYIVHLIPGVVHNFHKSIGCIGFLSPMHNLKIPGSYSSREGGNPGNFGLSS